MKREEAMHIMQMYKDEIGQRIDKADDPDLKDVYQWQMDGFDMAIESLQGDMYCPNCGVRLVPEDEYLETTQTHGRLIDADALSKKLCGTTIFIKDGEVFQRMINDAPTIQADRPHGEWKRIEYEGGTVRIECTNCGRSTGYGNFCRHCGADMRKEKK